MSLQEPHLSIMCMFVYIQFIGTKLQIQWHSGIIYDVIPFVSLVSGESVQLQESIYKQT